MIDSVYLTGSNQCLYTKKGEEEKENQLSPIHCTFQAGPLFAFVSYLAICHLHFCPFLQTKARMSLPRSVESELIPEQCTLLFLSFFLLFPHFLKLALKLQHGRKRKEESRSGSLEISNWAWKSLPNINPPIPPLCGRLSCCTPMDATSSSPKSLHHFCCL